MLSSCVQLSQIMSYEQRLQLLNFLVLIAQADGAVVSAEVVVLANCARSLGLSDADVDSMLNLKDAGSSLDAAYKVPGVSPRRPMSSEGSLPQVGSAEPSRQGGCLGEWCVRLPRRSFKRSMPLRRRCEGSGHVALYLWAPPYKKLERIGHCWPVRSLRLVSNSDVGTRFQIITCDVILCH